MTTLVIKAVLLVNILRLFIEAADPTNCIPDYFRYIHNDETNEFSGRIEIPGPPKGEPLRISVSLSIAAALPTKYVGRLELAQPRDQSVKTIVRGGTLKYNVRFPLIEPVPSLNEIWFNGERICHGRRATGHTVTSIVLNHTLYPPGVVLLNVDDTNVVPNLPNVADSPSQNLSPAPNEFPTLPVQPDPFIPTQPSSVPIFRPTPTVRPTPAVRPTLSPHPASHVLDFETQQQCGISNSSTINYLIAGGEKTMPGQYPWLAAIYLVLVPRYKFHCAGSLVTGSHVITAAHCFRYENSTLPIGALVVSLGRYKLLNFDEAGSVNRDVAGYTIHPDYSYDNLKASADADIAIIVLRTSVVYTAAIKPICLWSGPTSLDVVVDRRGTVVGWGRDEYGNVYVEEPRMIRAPIVNQETCLWSKNEFVFIASNRTFCAGTRNGTGPCNGDSGSGFILYESKVDRYFLRGIVSLSLLDKTNLSCDLAQYVVYVDVAQHLDWIYQQLSAQT
ncbi:CLIP domain-containing serine protease HP8 [Lasioglossum baleicum]|uniref:CLIP domain-containing serine protease HP8 n=1 Tax=Lasioglossum baleicum TaxID=434251 RepID=UPI003FCD49B5